jgi:hypothetical protein
MRLNRPLGAVKVASVTALAAAACAMWALPAGAATAAPSSVVKHATTTVVSVPKTGYTHTNIKLSATEKGTGGNPTGTVTFWLGTRKLCHGSLYRRTTSCSAQFTNPGTKTITAKYSGNALHKPSSGTAVIKVTNKSTTPPPTAVVTTTNITSPANTVWAKEQPGTIYDVVATVTAANGTVPTGTMTIAPANLTGPIPANVECVNAVVKNVAGTGTVTCPVTIATGAWGFMLYQANFTPSNPAQYTASVVGGLTHGGEYKVIDADVTVTQLGFNPATATAGDADTLTATVTDEPGKALADAGGGPDLVTFSIAGVNIPGCVNVAVTDPTDGADNVATCSYTPPAAGNVIITATYAGDDYADGSKDTETLTVNS